MGWVTAVLLAAGASRRMRGAHKVLLDWKGQPLLCYQLDQLLRLPVEKVVVVLGYGAEETRPLVSRQDPRIMVIVNPDYRRGKSSSVRLGVAQVGEKGEGVLILGVDQPRPAALLNKLLAAHRKSGALLSVPTYQGKHGHPLVYHRSLLPELLAISERRQGLREVTERHRRELHEVPLDNGLILANINTQRDYHAALKVAARLKEGETS
jgi:molybdenum cofactor cytidylyltransferase